MTPVNARRLALFRTLLRLFSPGRLVDLGCGHGRFAQEAVERGWEVTAVDARSERWPDDPRISWVQADVRDFSLVGFELICCLGLLYHLTLDDQRQLLHRCGGAPIMIDTHLDNGQSTDPLSDRVTVQGFEGRWYQELNHPAALLSSWGNDRSFWPTPEAFRSMLLEAGYGYVLEAEPAVLPGPSFLPRVARVTAEGTPVAFLVRIRSAIAGPAGAMLRSAARRWVDWSNGDGPVGPHITRYAMYQRLHGVGLDLGFDNDPATRVVAISRSEPLCELLGLGKATITSADFPTFDLRRLTFSDDSFDVLVADQVLEHIEADPSLPVRESFRVVRPGGLVVHTTCFVNPIHEEVDLFRFTPSALAMLFNEHGDVVEVGGWGNRLQYGSWTLSGYAGGRYRTTPVTFFTGSRSTTTHSGLFRPGWSRESEARSVRSPARSRTQSSRAPLREPGR